MDVPASQPGIFQTDDFTAGTNWTGKLTDPSLPGQSQPIAFGAGRPGFEYTAWSWYQKTDLTAGWMAFGLATPQSAVPVSGSATYTADVLGYGGAYFDGKATLNFNFGANTLGGNLEVWDGEWAPRTMSYYQFNFANTVVGSGSNLGQFSGELVNSANSQHGSFNGLFTGPNAQELMARWNATYPNSDNLMYGVWVGKKD
jgi:hypothetical protein